MKESIGYTVILNIVIVFIVIIFAFLSATLVYYKSYKVGNYITSAIEKCAGYNECSKTEISAKLTSIGYSSPSINCPKSVNDREAKNGECELKIEGEEGYCVYLCFDKNNTNVDQYYYYKVRTNMPINIPIINNLIHIPVFNNTNEMYNFACKFSVTKEEKETNCGS